MAQRRVVNRKQLREETEAAERSGTSSAPKKKKKKKATRSRAKAAKEVRLKAYWGVFNQALKQVDLFEYSERAAADKRAEELSKNTPHFVQPVKQEIQE